MMGTGATKTAGSGGTLLAALLALVAVLLLAVALAARPRAGIGAEGEPPPEPGVMRADSLYLARDWPKAVEAYGAVVKVEPGNGRAWFRLGVALQSSGDYPRAIEAYLKAEAIAHNALVMFNLAGAYAHQKRDDLAFDWLTRAADAGFRWHQAYLDDPDLARLRPDPRFVALESRIKGNGSPCTQRPEARQLDFWLGDWVCRTPQGAVAGRNSITTADQGCVILEHWADTQGGSGMSFNLYNPVTRKWQQTWMSSDGEIAEFSGYFQGHSMFLEGFRQGPNGDRIPARLTLTAAAPDTVRQLGENSADGGATWYVLYELIYTRK